MLDRENRLQQEAIGMLGVNLVYGAFHKTRNPDDFIASLIDGIGLQRIEVDMIEFNGPNFEQFDNRILCLKLTENGLTHAIMFDENGYVVQASENYIRNHASSNELVKSVTQVNLDMLETAKTQFVQRRMSMRVRWKSSWN